MNHLQSLGQPSAEHEPPLTVVGLGMQQRPDEPEEGGEGLGGHRVLGGYAQHETR